MYQVIKTGNSTIVTLDDYVLRFYKDGGSSQRLETICQILDYLRRRGGKVQEVISNNPGTFVDAENKFWITRYYSGEFHNGNESQLRNLAHEIAHIHALLRGWTTPFRYYLNRDWYTTPTEIEWEHINNLVVKNEQDKIAKDFLPLLRECHQGLKNCRGHMQLIHFDLHPKNVLFDGDDVSVILDFNAMRKLDVEQDIAFASFRFAFAQSKKIEFIRDYTKRFINYYQKINPIKLENLDQFLMKRLLYLTSYILKRRYVEGNPLEGTDLGKYVEFVKIAQGGIYD